MGSGPGTATTLGYHAVTGKSRLRPPPWLRQLTVPEFAAMGVRRISLGSMIARVTHAAIAEQLEAIVKDGNAHLVREYIDHLALGGYA